MVNNMRICENVRIADIIQDMRKNYSVGITLDMAWKANEITKGIVKGDVAKLYIH